MKFQLGHAEAGQEADSDELARTILTRFGLLPRKKDSQARMHSLLLELYERKKAANREKKPEAAVITVEEMGVYAGIARQTMYEYLGRWLDLNVLKKTSFVSNGKVIIGYELNGPTLECAFKKAQQTLVNHMDMSIGLIQRLQNEIKRDKLKGHAAYVKSEDSQSNESTLRTMP